MAPSPRRGGRRGRGDELQGPRRSVGYPGGPDASLDWVAIGTLDSGPAVRVRCDGLVEAWSGGPSIDWWVRGPDGWVYPSEAGPRQAVVDDAPIVRTTLFLERTEAEGEVEGEASGGAILQTVYGVAGNPDMAIIRFENNGDAPVAIAVAVRPNSLDAPRRTDEMRFLDGAVLVDGRPAAYVVGSRPRQVRTGSVHTNDVTDRLDDTGGVIEDAVVDSGGAATMALVYPLEHGGHVDVAVPLAAPGDPAERPFVRPAAPAIVGRGWSTQTDGAWMVTASPPAVTRLAATAPAALLLWGGGGDAPAPSHDLHRPVRPALPLLHEVARVGALLDVGLVRAAEERLLRLPALQRVDGSFLGGAGDSRRTPPDPDRTLAAAGAVSAVARHWRLTRDAGVRDALLGTAFNAVQWLRRTARKRRGSIEMRASVVRAMRDAAELGAAAGDGELAEVALEVEEAEAAALDSMLSRLGEDLPADGERGGGDPARGEVPQTLRACWPHGAVRPDHPLVRRVLDRVRGDWDDGSPLRAVASDSRVDVRWALSVAGALGLESDPRAWTLFAAIAGVSNAGGALPGVIGLGTDLEATVRGDGVLPRCEGVACLRSLLVGERPESLDLLPGLTLATGPGDVTATSLRTRFGRLDLHLRIDDREATLQWRGLWGAAKPVVSAPGIEPSWRTRDEAGMLTLPVATG